MKSVYARVGDLLHLSEIRSRELLSIECDAELLILAVSVSVFTHFVSWCNE